MIQIASDESRSDAPEFIALVEQIIRGAVTVHRPAETLLFRIDNWFDHKWLGFSGKTLGAVGVWSRKATPPPFVANRLVGSWEYVRDAGDDYVESTKTTAVHFSGRSDANLSRRLAAIAPNSALFWFSSESERAGKGSLMGYLPVEGEYWRWYVSFDLRDSWTISRRKEIHEYELRSFINVGAAGLAATDQAHSP